MRDVIGLRVSLRTSFISIHDKFEVVNSLPTWYFFHVFLSSAEFCQNHFFFNKNKKNQEYHQSAKQLGPRSGPTFCRA